MKYKMALAACAFLAATHQQSLAGAVITNLLAVYGPTGTIASLPIPVTTLFPNNDESPTFINFIQLFTSLPITETAQPVRFYFDATDTGTGGTTEYLINQWLQNASGEPWPRIKYSLTAQDSTGAPISVPGLDFDWPDLSTTGFGSSNYSSVDHQAHSLAWSGGEVSIGSNEITTFSLDVPDTGFDYGIIMTLEVPEPSTSLICAIGFWSITTRYSRRS